MDLVSRQPQYSTTVHSVGFDLAQQQLKRAQLNQQLKRAQRDLLLTPQPQQSYRESDLPRRLPQTWTQSRHIAQQLQVTEQFQWTKQTNTIRKTKK
jgi:hypothetical protein